MDALKKCMRSKRVLIFTIAELYVQGVSTRKISAIIKQLYGTGVTSSQVSRVAELLDEILESWQEQSLEEIIILH